MGDMFREILNVEQHSASPDVGNSSLSKKKTPMQER
jgi:hypothetical protein